MSDSKNTHTSQLSAVEQIRKLPVLPQVATRITERIQSPTATLQEIAELIQTDVGLTSKILRLANSSYYSIPGGVTDVSKALQFLGFTTIAQVVLTTSVFGSFKTQGSSVFPLDQFWKHSFAVGLVAEIAARNLEFNNAKDAFVVGLMHDMGKLILLEIFPDQLHSIVTYARENQTSFIQAEQALHLPTHTQLGVHLVDHWRLPPHIAAGIQHHHDAPETGTPDTLLIAWSNVWVHTQKIGQSGNHALFVEHEALENTLAKKLGLTPRHKEHIKKKFEVDFEKAGAILSGHS